MLDPLGTLIRSMEQRRRLLLDPATSLPRTGCEIAVKELDGILDTAWEFREIVQPPIVPDMTLGDLQAMIARVRARIDGTREELEQDGEP